VRSLINPAKLFKIKGYWDQFIQNHPKFPLFINAIQSNGIEEGSVIDITITTAEGKTFSTNIKVTQSDKEMLSELTELMKNS
jgi:hypothetical protein